MADIHFSPQRAMEAIEAGVAKIRLNPGNIKNHSDILRIIDAAKMHKTAIRIGVNEASIRDLKKQDVAAEKRTALMLQEMKKYVAIFEKRRFSSLVLSAKSSDALRTIEVNRAIAKAFRLSHSHRPYARRPARGCRRSLRQSLWARCLPKASAIPFASVLQAIRWPKCEWQDRFLTSLGLCPRTEPELIVCPTCGRAQIDVVKVAAKIRKALAECS